MMKLLIDEGCKNLKCYFYAERYSKLNTKIKLSKAKKIRLLIHKQIERTVQSSSKIY